MIISELSKAYSRPMRRKNRSSRRESCGQSFQGNPEKLPPSNKVVNVDFRFILKIASFH